MARLGKLLRENHFYPLAAASVIAMIFYIGERLHSQWHGPRLHLNLFLAWIPYGFALALIALDTLRTTPLVRVLQLICFLGWFFFFPNAPYLATDFAYLDWAHFDLWQRVAIFCAFSQCGLMLAMTSLLLVDSHVAQSYGVIPARIIVAIAILLSGAGVFIGRFLRWNSWDLLSHPFSVVLDAVEKFDQPVQGIRPIVFSVMFTLVLATYYAFILSLSRKVIPKSKSNRS